MTWTSYLHMTVAPRAGAWIETHLVQVLSSPDNVEIIHNNQYLSGIAVAESFMEEYQIEDPSIQNCAAVFFVRGNELFNAGIAQVMQSYGLQYRYAIINIFDDLNQDYDIEDLINDLRQGNYYDDEYFYYDFQGCSLNFIFADCFLVEIYECIESTEEIYVFGWPFSYVNMFYDPYFSTMIATGILDDELINTHFFLLYETEPVSSFIREILLGLQRGDSQINSYWRDVFFSLYKEEYGWVYYHIWGYFNECTVVHFDFMRYYGLA